jgi:Tfp pilus assembly protein PilN
MTVDIPTRAPEQQPPLDDRRSRRGLKGGPQITFGRSSRSAGKAPLVVGGQPRANLLPPEIILKRKQLKTRRALRVGVFFVFVATAAACVGVWGMASVSQVQLALAQEQQQALVNEQLTYGDVREVQTTIETIKAGQQVGASTEIDWRDYLTQLSASLPSGVALQSVSIESGTPMVPFAQADGPLKADRVAALSFTATSKALPSIPDWLRALEKLPGFVDATPGSVKFEEGVYVADVLMHINADAFSMRFDPEHVAAAEAAAEAAKKSDGTIKSMVAEPASEEAEGSATEDTTTEEGD